ncbi:hypothetical protein BC567DRAFT_218254 [Phyllosticta citribraziliensis]
MRVLVSLFLALDINPWSVQPLTLKTGSILENLCKHMKQKKSTWWLNRHLLMYRHFFSVVMPEQGRTVHPPTFFPTHPLHLIFRHLTCSR